MLFDTCICWTERESLEAVEERIASKTWKMDRNSCICRWMNIYMYICVYMDMYGYICVCMDIYVDMCVYIDIYGL